MGLGNLNNVADIEFDCTLFSNSIQSGLNAEMHPPSRSQSARSQSAICCGETVAGDFNSSEIQTVDFNEDQIRQNNPKARPEQIPKKITSDER